jgi:4-nitrophenyl phosphatase
VAVVIDLDGVIWLGSDPIPGGAGAIKRLRDAGERVVFLTNNSMPTRVQLMGKLARMGIDCGDDELINSPQAAASLLIAGERVLVVGGEGIVEAVERAGCEVVLAGRHLVPATSPASAGHSDAEPASTGRPGGAPENVSAETSERPAGVAAVVVGLDLRFDYQRLAEAASSVRLGARFIATNDDATYPMAEGLAPGGGSIVAAIATAAGANPIIAGKPHETVVGLLEQQVGSVSLVIGDRLSTDGALARRLNARFALVRTGVTAGGEVEGAHADLIGADLAEVVDRALA